MPNFKNGDLVDARDTSGFSRFNPWTVIDVKEGLYASESFEGHSGVPALIAGRCKGHCYYLPNDLFTLATFSLENE